MKQFIKRMADWMEKISVASVAVGLFQGDKYAASGIVVGVIALAISHGLDYLGRKYD